MTFRVRPATDGDVAAIAWAGENGYRQLTVRTDTRRAESRAFYPALGFEAFKEQHVYKRDASPHLLSSEGSLVRAKKGE